MAAPPTHRSNHLAATRRQASILLAILTTGNNQPDTPQNLDKFKPVFMLENLCKVLCRNPYHFYEITDQVK